jgi:hypothetical protein
VYEAFDRIGKIFAAYSVRRSHGREGTKRQIIRLLLLFKLLNRDKLQIQTHSEISRFSICNEACPTPRRVAACTKASAKCFSDKSSEYDEGHGQY